MERVGVSDAAHPVRGLRRLLVHATLHPVAVLKPWVDNAGGRHARVVRVASHAPLPRAHRLQGLAVVVSVVPIGGEGGSGGVTTVQC